MTQKLAHNWRSGQTYISEIAEYRSSLSLAAQVVYQAKVIDMLRQLAKGDCGPQICTLLLDPTAMAKAYAEAYGTEGEPYLDLLAMVGRAASYPPAVEPDDY